MKKKIILIIVILLVLMFSIIGLISYNINYKATTNSTLLKDGECCTCPDHPELDVCCSCEEYNIFLRIIDGWKLLINNY